MHATFDRLRERHRSEEGFTLIELLVVVVIIGILVAIAVPVYLNYRQGAADKSAQSDVRGAISAVEQFYTDNGNAYPQAFTQNNNNPPTTATRTLVRQDGSASANPIRVTLSDQTQLTYVVSGATYRVCARNTGGTRTYLYDSASGGSVISPATAPSMTTCA
jgi:type IV pilus assembly protein PilA